MSSETDQPRQRTVAELLAAHGGQAAAPGRRRRRREADESTDEPRPVAVPGSPAPSAVAPPAQRVPAAGPAPGAPLPSGPPRTGPLPSTPPQAGPPQATGRIDARPPNRAPANGTPQGGPWAAASPAQGGANGSGPVRENPTDVIPRVREPQPVEDLGRLSRRDRSDAPVDDDGGPSTMVGMAPPGAEAWHAVRTGPRRDGGTAIDGGPPLPSGPVAADERPAGLGPVDLRKQDDGYDESDPDDPGTPPERERRLGRSARESVSTAWSTVLVQWLAGALGGAVLWVAFRFLWRSLPVVAVAAAIAVTVGLVLVVRALLHNDDRRTTVFAVLVGLLLTVSPAILVVLGR